MNRATVVILLSLFAGIGGHQYSHHSYGRSYHITLVRHHHSGWHHRRA